MTKNIPVLSFVCCIGIISFLESSQKTIIVDNLSDTNVAYLRTVLSQQKNSSLHIQVQPEKNTYYQAFYNFLTTPYRSLKSRLTFTSLAKTTFSMVISLGWIGYLICAYSIYRVYRLISSISSWVNWCTDKDLLLSSDELLYEKFYRYKRIFKTASSLPKIRDEVSQEEKLLLTYFAIDNFLRKYNVRNYFPYSTLEFNAQVKKSYLRLLKIQNIIEQNHADV